MNRLLLFRDEFIIEYLSKFKIPPEITRKYILNNLSTHIQECKCNNIDDYCFDCKLQTCLNCSLRVTYRNIYVAEYYHYCTDCICQFKYCPKLRYKGHRSCEDDIKYE